MNLYMRDTNKILVNEFKVNEEALIAYNKKKIEKLCDEDSYKKTSDLLYFNRKSLKQYEDYKDYKKIYYKIDGYRNIYLFPKINQKSNSLYNKFSSYCNQDINIEKFGLDKLPKKMNIDMLTNNKNEEEYFYYSDDQMSAIKLDYELELLYKLLYLKYFELNYNKKYSINKDEFKKIFSISFKEVISFDTYYDIINKYNDTFYDRFNIYNGLSVEKVDKSIKKDEELIKKIHMILSKRY